MTIEQGQTKVANMALTALGLERIENMDQKNDSASYMKDYYPIVLRRILAERDWNFARRTVDIYPTNPPTVYKNYQLAFALPEDYVAIQRLAPEQYFEIYDNDKLVCNTHLEREEETEGDPIIVKYVELTYTMVAEDPMKFSPGFFQYFAYSLASEVAFMLTGDNNIMNTVLALNNSYQTIAYVEDSRRARYSQDYGKLPWHRNKTPYYAHRYRDELEGGIRYGR